MGENLASQSLAVSSYRVERVGCRQPNCFGAGEGGQFLPPERVQEKCSEVFRGNYEHRPVNSCNSVRCWTKAEFFVHKLGMGGDHAPCHLFDQLLDGLMGLGWVRGSTVEASKAEYQFFVREQKQLERISTRTHAELQNVLWSWSSQAGFRACRYLYQVGEF